MNIGGRRMLFKPEQWPASAAILVQGAINIALRENGICHVMLTGGRSAERLYAAWASLPVLRNTGNVKYYFSDERCVPPDNPESNYGMAMRVLFSHGNPAQSAVVRMEAEDPNREAAAARYGEKLPDKIDVLLLGVGEDGHIASLFPGSPLLQERSRRVAHVLGPKPPYERLTVTPMVIARAHAVFVLASGEAKAAVLASALSDPANVNELPARLVLGGNWLLDAPLL